VKLPASIALCSQLEVNPRAQLNVTRAVRRARDIAKARTAHGGVRQVSMPEAPPQDVTLAPIS